MLIWNVLIDLIVSFCSFTFNILWMNIMAQTKMLIFYLGFAAVRTIEISISIEVEEIVCFQFIRRSKNVLSEILFLKSCKWWKWFHFMDTEPERRIVCIWTWCAINFLFFEHSDDTFMSESMCCIKEHIRL